MTAGEVDHTRRITVSDSPDAKDADRVLSGLGSFNLAAVGPSNRQPLASFYRLEPGADIDAGLIGFTAWDWLYVEKLWVSEAVRGRGVAASLLAAAEAHATGRGCKAAWIDTFNPCARALYIRCGYTVFGELPDFTAGRTRVFLQKRFT